VTLATPPPPPRVVVPQPLNAEEPPAPVAPPAAPPETTSSSTKPRPQANNSKPTEKPEPPSASQPAPEPPSPVSPPAPGADPLETATRRLLTTAENDLRALDPKDLSEDARAHFQRAQSFITQAFTALRNKNYPFAEQLAKNAATLAKELRKLLAVSATTFS